MSYEELNILHGSKNLKKRLVQDKDNKVNLNINHKILDKNIGDEQIIPSYNNDAKYINDIYKLKKCLTRKL